MKSHRRRLESCWLLGLAALAGCNTTGHQDGLQAKRPAASASAIPAIPAPHDLSPKQAVKACLAVGAELEKTNYLAEAVEQYQKALKFDPQSVEAAHRLAVAHDQLGNLVQAQAEYKRALELSPNDPNILNDMGYFCYERSNWEEAERWLNKALAADPKNGRARVNLGMALAQQGKTKPALDAFLAVVSPAEAQANLGMILAQRGQVEEAKQAFRTSLADEPDAKVVQAALATLERPGTAGADLDLLKTGAGN